MNLRSREVKYEVGDLVLAYLRKEIFPKGEYNKYLKFKKIGPCKILRKFSANAYELQLPDGIGISPIFNISDLYPYENDGTKQVTNNLEPGMNKEVKWEKHMPMAKPLDAENILDTRLAKKTRCIE